MKYPLVNHVKVVICAINHFCDVCVERCCAIDDLVVHLTAKHGITYHFCHVFDDKFCRKGALVDHLKALHGITLHSCDVCDKSFCSCVASLNVKHGIIIHSRLQGKVFYEG